MTEVEQKALELYPVEMDNEFEENLEQLEKREAFLKGVEYAKQSKEEEVESYTSDLIEGLDDDSISTLKSMVRVGIKMADIENWRDGEYFGDAQKYVDIALSQIDRWLDKQSKQEEVKYPCNCTSDEGCVGRTMGGYCKSEKPQPQEKVDYQKMFAMCKLPQDKRLREAADEHVKHLENRKTALAATDGERFVFDFCIASFKRKFLKNSKKH